MFRWLRQILRKNTAIDEVNTHRERKKAAENTDLKTIIGVLETVIQQLLRASDQGSPENKEKRALEWSGVKAVWAAAAVGLIAIVTGSIDSYQQRRVMQGTLNEMRDEQRAWVYWTATPVGDLTITEKSGRIHAAIFAKFSLKNSGHLPARAIIAAHLFAEPPFGTPYRDRQNLRECRDSTPSDKRYRLVWDRNRNSGYTRPQDIVQEIFPGQEPRPFPLLVETIANPPENLAKDRWVRFVIAGCVLYRSGGDESVWHKTGIWVFLYWADARRHLDFNPTPGALYGVKFDFPPFGEYAD